MVPVPIVNPFATRFTRPGRIEPLDGMGRSADVERLLGRLRSLGGTAAIVGPHGSGKSTLLVHLADALERRGERVGRVRLHSWRDASSAWTAIRRSRAGGIVCIDSWECIGFGVRSMMRLAARLSGCDLLVTAHHGTGMPELTRCGTSASLLRSILAALPDHDAWFGAWISEADVEAAFVRHEGNLREALYELYDRFEVCARHARECRGDGPDGGDDCAVGSREIHETPGGFSCAGAPERNLG